MSKIQSAGFDHCCLLRKLSLSVFSESLLCMCDTLVVLTDPTFCSFTQTLPELLSGYNQRVCKSLILLQSLHSFRGVFEDGTYHPVHALQQVCRQMCHACYLAHFMSLCIIFVGSVWQEGGCMVLVSTSTVFLLDLSFQQFT